MEKNIGKIVQITGPVVDVQFASSKLPKINNALIFLFILNFFMQNFISGSISNDNKNAITNGI